MHEQRCDPQAFTFDSPEAIELHVHKTSDFANVYALEQFLQSTRYVSNLVVSARKQLDPHFRSDYPENNISRAWAAVFKQRFPRLKTLWLRIIVCTEEELTSFLIDHRATLEGLSVQDLIRGNWKRRPQQIGYDNSVFRLLWLLEHALTLGGFELHGYIADDWAVSW